MTFEEATAKALLFRDEREWAAFHNLKDLALSISIEAAELLEVFQWSGTELETPSQSGRAAEELADVAIYCIYMADRLGVNLADIINDKLKINGKNYPLDKSRGNSRKHTTL